MTFACWEGLASAGAIEADRAVPHDLLEGGGLLEARLLQPQLVIGMDGAACPRRAIEGLWRQWQQRALLLGLEDEPGDLADGAMHAGARQFPTPSRRARLHVSEVEEVPPRRSPGGRRDPSLHFRFPGGAGPRNRRRSRGLRVLEEDAPDRGRIAIGAARTGGNHCPGSTPDARWPKALGEYFRESGHRAT